MTLKTESVNVEELYSISPSILIDFFHVVSLIYSKTTRQHTEEFVLYKTKNFVKNALYWINIMYDVNDKFEELIRTNVNNNIELFKSNVETPDHLIEYVSNSVVLGDSKIQLDLLDYIVVLLSLVSYKYSYSLDQILDI